MSFGDVLPGRHALASCLRRGDPVSMAYDVSLLSTTKAPAGTAPDRAVRRYRERTWP
jgi:hypothetical protein